MKEKLIELGIGEELIKSIMEEQEKELKGYIKKETFEEEQNQVKELKKQLKERNTQLENLKKNSGDNEELKNQITELQKTNVENEQKYQEQLKEFKINSAIENVAVKNGAKNTKALKALLNFEGITVTDEGVIGLNEQIEKLKESESFLFEKETITNPVISSNKKEKKEGGDDFDKFLEQKKKEKESNKGLDELKVIN